MLERSVRSTLLRLDHVSVDRGPVNLLHDVTAEVYGGDVIVCTGDNGAGKTTLLRIMGGLLAPSRGLVDSPRDWSRADMIGHTSALHADLTLAENLALVARIVGRQPVSVATALDRVGLLAAADRRASLCSEGMRRRADLARLLLTKPTLLLLDEPDVALDRGARPLVRDVISRTVDRGGAVVVATHAPDQFADIATAVWSIRDGSVSR